LHAAIAHAPIALFATDSQGIITFYEGGPLDRRTAAHVSPVGETIDGWIGQTVDVSAFTGQASASAPVSTLVETGGEAYEVWWLPEHDGTGVFVGGTGVAALVTDTVRARRAAERAQAAAVELAQLRSNFVASVSHELRTPLTSIIGYGELLLAHWDHFDDPQRRERLCRIVASANRQKRLVDDLLALSRLDTEEELPVMQPLRLADLVESVVQEIQGTYPGQRIDRDRAVDLLVRADRDRIVRILTNIVDNAAKYSPEGSPIQVVWARQGDDVVIHVRDFGPGIADEHRNDLFTRFGRIPGSHIRSGHVGTGLGLYLGRQLARAMGGELDLETTGPHGSVFRLQVPAA
jgi:signal transduction histidine kinase